MGVYVVGMHRSGTSALAGLISSLCGLPAGRLAVPSNPTGQWERPEFRPALELLLAWNRLTWAHPPPETTQLSLPPPLGFYGRRVFARHGIEPFLWKDPRLCLTIDRWLSLPQDRPAVIMIHRQPMAVAASMARRNGWSIDRGLALWERTNRNAVARLTGHEIYALAHADLVAEPEAVANDLARWLSSFGLESGPEGPERAAATVHRQERPESEPGDALADAQEALTDRLGLRSGPTRIDLDGVGPESPATAELLGSPSTAELIRRTARALLAMSRRHPIEVASRAAGRP